MDDDVHVVFAGRILIECEGLKDGGVSDGTTEKQGKVWIAKSSLRFVGDSGLRKARKRKIRVGGTKPQRGRNIKACEQEVEGH